MSLLALLACTSSVEPPECTVDLDGPVVVSATADDLYTTGGLAAASLDGEAVCDVATLHGDAVVDVADGVVYAINRLGSDAIRRYDVLDAAPTWEVSTGDSSNPYAVVGAGDTLVVVRYAEPELLLLDAVDGSVTGTVDLSPWADADGIPEAAGAIWDGEHVFVVLQRLARPGLDPSQAPPGVVVAIDVELAAVTFEVSVGPNPQMAAHPDGGVVVVDRDGGWWRVDRDGTAMGPVAGRGLTESLAVASDGRVVTVSRDCLDCARQWVACRDAWDAEPGGQTEPVAAYLSDVLVVDDTIWVAARRGWEEPEAFAGGFVTLPLDSCGPMPHPETWLRGTFAPYDLALRP